MQARPIQICKSVPPHHLKCWQLLGRSCLPQPQEAEKVKQTNCPDPAVHVHWLLTTVVHMFKRGQDKFIEPNNILHVEISKPVPITSNNLILALSSRIHENSLSDFISCGHEVITAGPNASGSEKRSSKSRSKATAALRAFARAFDKGGCNTSRWSPF